MTPTKDFFLLGGHVPLTPQLSQANQESQFNQIPSGLNPFQSNRLAVTCHYIDLSLAFSAAAIILERS